MCGIWAYIVHNSTVINSILLNNYSFASRIPFYLDFFQQYRRKLSPMIIPNYYEKFMFVN